MQTREENNRKSEILKDGQILGSLKLIIKLLLSTIFSVEKCHHKSYDCSCAWAEIDEWATADIMTLDSESESNCSTLPLIWHMYASSATFISVIL